jgi:hypothetical protein
MRGARLLRYGMSVRSVGCVGIWKVRRMFFACMYGREGFDGGERREDGLVCHVIRRDRTGAGAEVSAWMDGFFGVAEMDLDTRWLYNVRGLEPIAVHDVRFLVFLTLSPLSLRFMMVILYLLVEITVERKRKRSPIHIRRAVGLGRAKLHGWIRIRSAHLACIAHTVSRGHRRF